MSSFKDIAQKAGVSYGTVSNVINKKGNVSLEKILKAEQAAKALGYVINKNASSLRSGKSNDIVLIVSTLENATIRKIHSILTEKCNSNNTNLKLHITNFNPLLEKELVRNSLATSNFLIVYSSLDNDEEFYNNLTTKTNIILLNSFNTSIKNSNIFTIDFDVSKLIEKVDYYSNIKFKKTLLFTDYNLTQYLVKNPYLTLEQCIETNNLIQSIKLLSENTFDYIITTSIEKKKAIESAYIILNIEKRANIIYISSDDSDYSSTDVQYVPNINYFLDEIWNIISLNNKTNRKIYIPFIKNNHYVENSFSTDILKLLLVESPSTSALEVLLPFIENKLGFKITIDTIKYNEYYKLEDDNFIKNYDLIRIDMANLRETAYTIFKPLKEPFLDLSDNFIDNLEQYMYVNNELYTLPFDIAAMIMLYRSDVLNNQTIKRQFFEETRNTDLIPNDFAKYNQIENFISKHYSDIYNPSSVCFKANITAGNEFIVRVPHNNIIDNNTELNINDPAILKALKSYSSSIKHSENHDNMFWDDVIKEFSHGNTLLAITYSNYIHNLRTYNEDLYFKTNFMNIPGNKSLIGGGVIGLSKYSEKDDLAYLFLQTIYTDNISKLLIQLGAAMPTKSIYADKDLIYRFPWLGIIPKIISNNIRGNYTINNEPINTLEYEKLVGKLVKNYIAST